MNEDQIRDLFREMRDEVVPADSLARLRMRVSERTRHGARWKVAGWVMACAAALFAAMLLESGVTLRKAIVPAVASRLQAPEQPLPLFPAREPLRPAVRRMRATPRPQPLVQTVSIRIETSDPDVVIWLVGN
jgi:hypothetical protein